jgi:pimeloyl-ACP methyl ester carboxylesterase
MADNLRGSRVVELDCKHWVPLDEPAKLAALIEEHWVLL